MSEQPLRGQHTHLFKQLNPHMEDELTSPAPSPLFYNPNSRMLMDDSHREIAIMYEWHDLKNNVEFIVKAVNSYTAHLALIEELTEAVEFTSKYTRRVDKISEEIYQKATDALAKSRKVLGGSK